MANPCLRTFTVTNRLAGVLEPPLTLITIYSLMMSASRGAHHVHLMFAAESAQFVGAMNLPACCVVCELSGCHRWRWRCHRPAWTEVPVSIL